eukprot:Cvel_20795.t2-p1 / transcript=Cvel_20795.t2 / gene=Cvel_20795 / organism=Chromera_velia_CCMP2878 / gene_product=hypothetical protein / transcript_product=hypothetical protein / location=Cvel_scaffold1899:12913-14337(+) / protein_length=475 / sequence_SO=supercontig / SO=protein_coding / is_pseudo=false
MNTEELTPELKQKICKAGVGCLLSAALPDEKMLKHGSMKMCDPPLLVKQKRTYLLLSTLADLGAFVGEYGGFREEFPIFLETLKETQEKWSNKLEEKIAEGDRLKGEQIVHLLLALSTFYGNVSNDRVLRRRMMKHPYTLGYLRTLLSYDHLKQQRGPSWTVPLYYEMQDHAAMTFSNLAVEVGSSGSGGRSAHLQLYQQGILALALEVAGRVGCSSGTREVCCQIVAECAFHPAVARHVTARMDWMARLCVLSVSEGLDWDTDMNMWVGTVESASIAIMRALQCADPPPCDFLSGSSATHPFPIPVSDSVRSEFVKRVEEEAERMGLPSKKTKYVLNGINGILHRFQTLDPVGKGVLEGSERACGGNLQTAGVGAESQSAFVQQNCLRPATQTFKVVSRDGGRVCGFCGKMERPNAPWDKILMEKGVELVDKLLVCTACRKEFYCSRECQKAHWKTHKALCRAPACAASGGAMN